MKKQVIHSSVQDLKEQIANRSMAWNANGSKTKLCPFKNESVNF